jgi:wobble nucleotide-excising tRNase
MRRILENYFRISGGKSPEEILKHFDGEQKIICNSLLSWINEGSHGIPDDAFASLDADTVGKYREVFRQVFVHMGHENHYKMMMREAPDIFEDAAATPPILAGAAA